MRRPDSDDSTCTTDVVGASSEHGNRKVVPIADRIELTVPRHQNHWDVMTAMAGHSFPYPTPRPREIKASSACPSIYGQTPLTHGHGELHESCEFGDAVVSDTGDGRPCTHSGHTQRLGTDRKSNVYTHHQHPFVV